MTLVDETTDNVRQIVLKAVGADPLAALVDDVQVELGVDEDDEEFLRVALVVRLPDRNVDAELEGLLERIEEAVARIDDRYPSVRFLDAA